MRKGKINTWCPYLLLLLATSIYGCGSGGDSSKSPSQTQTQIDYVINLDETRKTREEGNKIYYKVPLGTKASIMAKVTGLPTVEIDWEQNPRYPSGNNIKMFESKWHSTYHKVKRNGRVIVEESTAKMHSAWEFTSMTPTCVTVTGKPHRMDPSNEQGNNIINNEKVFVITWK